MPIRQPPPPALAGAAGRYRESAPPPALRRFFQCVWTNVLPARHVGEIVVVPDGCVDLIWKEDRLWVAGPDRVAARPALGPGAQVIGARFRPGAARHWLGLPMAEIVGRLVDAAELPGGWAREFAGRLQDAPTLARRIRLFQERLAAVPPPVAGPDPGAAHIFRLAAADHGRAIARMREHLGIGERTLRRHCHDHFGYGPKTLERILRFQRVLCAARDDPAAGLALLAAAAGYADQAHLAREVRALCGMSASALLAQARR